jgi:hypothetical protein
VALTSPMALVRAHYQSLWNRTIRDAGFGGKIAHWVMLAIVAILVALPGLFAFRIGRELGAELASSGDLGVLRGWNALQATFTVAFALFGSFRHEPSFPFSRFGRYPVTPLELLLADLPSSLFEVFPLLGGAAILLTNFGLATRMPGSSPIVALLALDGVATLLAVMFIASALRSFVSGRRKLLQFVVVGTVVSAIAAGPSGLLIVLKHWLPAFAQSIPGAHGYAGLLALRSGAVGEGLWGIGYATFVSALLFLIAARVHSHRLMAEVESPIARGGGDFVLRFGTPAAGIGRVFLGQLLGSRSVRGQLALPLLFSGPLAFVIVVFRVAIADGKVFPDDLLALVRRVEAAPLYALVPLSAVATNSIIWMNQFGWDRGGMRTLLLLPLDTRALLVGKLRGLLGFTALQAAVGVVPLFWVRKPDARELVLGAAAFGIVFLATATVGQIVSIRFPRGIDGGAGLQIPLHLSWIPAAALLLTTGGLAAFYAAGELVAPRAGVVGVIVLFAGGVIAYVAALPRLAAFLRAHRERLVSM